MTNPLDHLSEPAKAVGDALSVGAVIASLFSWLPQISALLAAVWLVLRLVIGWQEYLLNRRKLRGER